MIESKHKETDMAYKYYSRMRPVGIGTFPGKPEKITNYPEGRKTVTAGDGTQIQAWVN